MKINRIYLFLFLLIIACHVSAQTGPFAKINGNLLVLDNGHVKRQINMADPSGQYTSTQLVLADDDKEFLNRDLFSLDFRFSVNGISYSGKNAWEFLSAEPAVDTHDGSGAKVRLRGTGAIGDLKIEISYLLYPGLPLIRKHITFTNTGKSDIKIEAVDVEHLELRASPTRVEVYHDYCRKRHLGPYVGTWNDPVMALHIIGEERGVILGNEAPGVIKRIAYFTERDDFSAGLTYPDQDHPFRKWLQEGESFTTPDVFLILYNKQRSPYHALNIILPAYVKNHMGLEIFGMDYKPVFVYNTWNPFRHNVNEKMIRELTAAASECGIEEFIIDDGWQTNAFTDKSQPGFYTHVGDYIIDLDKFPNGLKPVFDDIKSKGMKPGLWLSIGSANISARVFHEHPEWYVKGIDGRPSNLHSMHDSTMMTACMSTGWTGHIRDVILDLVDEHGLSYTKLDFAVVTSAYVTDPAISGCYATDHQGHRDQQESFMANYRGLFRLFDELQEKAPELFIDCTFETQGKLHLIDYAFLKHAEGNWLANMEEAAPSGALRVRHLAWARTPVIPAAACVIGNLRLDSPDLEFDFLSLLGSFPIMLGDVRETPPAKREWLKTWADWLRDMQEKYDYMSYRQDLKSFGEPAEGRWDGWQRINMETRAGGIVGVFRQGSTETTRNVTVEGLLPSERYEVVEGAGQTVLYSLSGKDLAEKGFAVTLERDYQGKVFEIRLAE